MYVLSTTTGCLFFMSMWYHPLLVLLVGKLYVPITVVDDSDHVTSEETESRPLSEVLRLVLPHCLPIESAELHNLLYSDHEDPDGVKQGT